jgi:hypothetical protein
MNKILNLYCPPNKTSKAYYVLDNARKGWNGQINDITNYRYDSNLSLFWGFAHQNYELIQKRIQKGHDWLFADMGYLGRWNGLREAINPNADYYWRICKNKTNQNEIMIVPDDRFKKFDIKLKDWRKSGNHILVCPSSVTMNNFITQPNWLEDTIHTLKKFTDRPIRVRQKPRARGTSGPMAATVPLSEDLKNCWAVVTAVSATVVESAIAGIPVFSHHLGPGAGLGNINYSQIETPKLNDREPWLSTLCYSQFTPKEIASGEAFEILKLY